MKDPTYGPVYACLYPELAKIARSHGYALAVHGTVSRDFDLICIPWIEKPSEPEEVIKEILNKFYFKTIGEPEYKLHNRLVYTVALKFGECFLDLSFMPFNKGQENGKID